MTRVTIIAFDAGVGRSYIATDTVSVDSKDYQTKEIHAPIR